MMGTKDKVRLQEIAHKYLQGKLSREDKMEFDHWFNQIPVEPIEVSPSYAKQEDAHRKIILKRIKKEVETSRPRTIKMWRNIAAAMAIILTIGIGLLFLRHQQTSSERTVQTMQDKTVPGKNMATLTLSGGRKLVLSNTIDEKLLKETGVEVQKAKNGQLIYKQIDHKNADHLIYNTLATSRGQQYQLILPDGSHIWLNSGSSVKFPVSFAGLKERKVFITGEVYFEVSKDQQRPFRVISEGQQVTVHGTHFNINGYQDEPESKTTLLEGSVDINGTLLKPNQQAVLGKDELKVIPVDAENVIAWKDGYFRFSNESLESIMRKVSRWYDVEVVFEDPSLKNTEFGGVMTKYTTVSKVLEMLELTGEVSFVLKGKKIVVKNKN
jgi:hypothetical protein